MNLKTAIEPRIDTEAHRYKRVARKAGFTRKGKPTSGLKSVLIRVHPWFFISGRLPTAEARMNTCESLNHTKWKGKYQVVFIPKCRRKVLDQGIRQELGTVFRSLAERWKGKVEEGASIVRTNLSIMA